MRYVVYSSKKCKPRCRPSCVKATQKRVSTYHVMIKHRSIAIPLFCPV